MKHELRSKCKAIDCPRTNKKGVHTQTWCPLWNLELGHWHTLNKGNVFILEGDRRVEEIAKQDDGKFVVKLGLRGFKPEDIKLQLREHELTVTGKHKSDDQGFYFSREYSHRVLLPDDVDLGSVTSLFSKESLLIIEASRDQALLPKERNLDVSMEDDEQSPEDEAKQVASGDTEEHNKN